MNAISLRTFAGNVWPPVPASTVSQIWSAYCQLEQIQWQSRDRIEAGQLAQLRLLLAHCVQHVPYYRRVLAEARLSPDDIRSLEDLRRLPILTRRVYQENFTQLNAISLPPGTTRTESIHTTGTSGVPLDVPQTNVVGLWWFACHLRDAAWTGIDHRGCLASLRGTDTTGAELRRHLQGVSHPVWNQLLHSLVATGPFHVMDIHQDPRQQLEWLFRIQPDYLQSYPLNLACLAGLLAEQERRIPSLRLIQSFAETLTEEDRQGIEAGFGVPVKNLYSCSEAGYVASPCPEGYGLHVHAENVIVEILDENDQPCPPGGTGRVVLTTLHNFQAPFIRYEIQDEATVGPESCPCGRGLPLIERIQGRRRPALQLTDGRLKSSAALSTNIGILGVCHQFQIVQQAVDQMVVRLIPNRRWSDAARQRVIELVHECLEAPVHVTVECLDCLPLPPGGKLQIVVNEINKLATAPQQPAPPPATVKQPEPSEPDGAIRPFFPLRHPAGYVWPSLPSVEAGRVWSAYLELDRTQWLDREHLEEGQLAQIRTLLAHCLRHVPYYRQVLTEAGLRPDAIHTWQDFRAVPMLPRDVFRGRFAQFRAEQLPTGTQPSGKVSSSGTSGIPVDILQTNEVKLWWLATYLRDAEWCGIDQRGKLAVIRATGKTGAELTRLLAGVSSPTWNPHLQPLLRTGPCFGMDIHQDPRRQLEWLRHIQPDYLLSFPSNLEYLANLIERDGERIVSLKAIQTIAEILSPEVQARIESVFGVPVKNTYSCSEAGCLASPCPDGHGYHVHAENVLLEVLDDQGQPCRPGRTGNVVLTHLHNFLTPIIRYQIMDEATLGPARCPCGRGLPLLTYIQGKRHPMFRLPGGSAKIATGLIMGLRHLRVGTQFQIIQKSLHHVIIRVVPDHHWSTEHPSRITQMVHDFFEFPIQVDVVPVERIELPPGGKLQAIISEVDDTDAYPPSSVGNVRESDTANIEVVTAVAQPHHSHVRSHTPSWHYQLRTLPGNTWPTLPRPQGSQVWAAYLELERTQWLDPEVIEQGQLTQLRMLLDHCRRHVPYYRRLLADLGMESGDFRTMADFRCLPLLHRQRYQQQLQEFIADALPPGTRATARAFTSGSSGYPVEVLQTNMVYTWWFAFYLRDSAWCGFDHRRVLAAIRTTRKTGAELEQLLQGVVFPFWHQEINELVQSGPCHLMDIHQDPRVMLQWLRRIQPDYLLNFPSNLDFLAGLIREEGKAVPSLRGIHVIAESLLPEVQQRIESAFGVPVYNTYSCTEAGYLASPCPERHGLHVHAENVILEVLDDEGRPVRPGETGRVVLTTLHNFRAPFIRYDILDQATLGVERCPCGRGLPLLSRVDGRRRPMFVLPNGQRRNCSPLVIDMENLTGYYQYQIVQKAVDRVLIRVVPNRAWNENTARELTRMVHEFFQTPIHVEIECVDHIELPTGGKHKIALCEVETA
ncbi:MAG: phenylacetate--CoA ligase family protein [Gemmataceae bacterium]